MTTAPAQLLLILDTETSGIDESKHEVLEIAAILYSVDHHCTLQQISTLIPTDLDTNPAEAINNISIAAANATPAELSDYLCQTINYWGQIATYVVAHNAEFDRKWFKEHPILADLYDQAWLCTCHDFTWPKQHRQGQKLIDLALAHGIGVSSAHRALTDCQLLAALFDRMDDLPAMIASATSPKVKVKAEVSYGDRQLAKDAGFRWDGAHKQWVCKLREAELTKFPFPCTVLERAETTLSKTTVNTADSSAADSSAAGSSSNLSKTTPKPSEKAQAQAVATNSPTPTQATPPQQRPPQKVQGNARATSKPKTFPKTDTLPF